MTPRPACRYGIQSPESNDDPGDGRLDRCEGRTPSPPESADVLARTGSTMTSISLSATATGKADAVVVGVYATETAKGVKGVALAPGAETVDAAYGGSLAKALDLLGAAGKDGELTRVPAQGDVKAPLIVAVGLGAKPGKGAALAHRHAAQVRGRRGTLARRQGQGRLRAAGRGRRAGRRDRRGRAARRLRVAGPEDPAQGREGRRGRGHAAHPGGEAGPGARRPWSAPSPWPAP